MCYDIFVNKIRVFLIFIYILISTRLISETNSCPVYIFNNCLNGYSILIPFLISTYFCDFIFYYLANKGFEKKDVILVIFSLPYIAYVLLSIGLFIGTSTIISVEYIANYYIFLSIFVYIIFFYINKIKIIYKLNYALMISFIFAFVLFAFL
ncbi:hypothetical protein A2V49_03955 [candidate division WWE3 bacterium RBG_19FT_COMBO_34_6]|uniref:Uncharacterized protein n=1 Tax=candidate division WWE3 bacterium RBG_19FT_COMBO_34_6 TaxID=1802612 RepID=A0A1F4ULT8_UNCKA|nr:MAG: hypothetical protein A2V49_03955 [candidate division WWE3 bacterium RBG_19FT_COMBO_34_6]